MHQLYLGEHFDNLIKGEIESGNASASKAIRNGFKGSYKYWSINY